MNTKIIVLDPGHGGHDSGALGPHGTKEAERTLDMCRRIREYLTPYCKVILTRESDVFIELAERARIANAAAANIFVSYHFNSGSSPKIPLSFETFTTPGQNNSDKLAECIINNHMKLCPWQKLRADTSDGDSDKEANYAVIRRAACPAVLIEGEFINTVDGEKSILDVFHQDLRARGVALGILEYLKIAHTIQK